MSECFYQRPGVAESWDRLFVPNMMSAPGADAAAALRVREGSRLLDVGCGTGAASLPAMKMAGGSGIVVALDPSVEMLRVLQKKGACLPVSAHAPGLPFPDSTFDGVMANFVLAHLLSYRTALADMIRVLRSGGRFAATSWAAGQNPFSDLWKEVVSRFYSLDRLAQAFRKLVPWEDLFSDESTVKRCLSESGFTGVEVERREYGVSISTADFVKMREWSLEGRLLRERLEDAQWHRLRHELLSGFGERFPDRLEYRRPALLASGSKPEPPQRE